MTSLSNVAIDLTGKVALITGGTRGIGKAIAYRFLDAGATIIITGTKKNEIQALSNSSQSDRITYLQVDFTDQNSIDDFFVKIKLLGKIDILVNNAGINKVAFNTETETKDFDLLNTINVRGPYLLCREISKLMKLNNYGRIVNITSIWSIITRPGRSIYTANKFAMVGLTKTLAVELGEYDILVNSVAPGFTLTDLTAATNTPEEISNLNNIIPMKRMALPLEIANLVLFLSSGLNTYLTGQNIIIDGGYTSV